ncbi:permease for cytosine/purines, uracil, thiamine, allantoin-domain-containing protein [Xylariales sp. PMI_506]|nr:permease for cytosine/purines, uracil, thiamine, allantoin-domain-containing protein [Xylariales sp. PMI_506]
MSGAYYGGDDEKKIGQDVPIAVDASSSEDVPGYLRGSAKTGFFAKLRGYEEALDRKLGVESHGIDRKLPEDRDPAYAKWSNQLVMFALWASGTMNLSCFATGFLGWELGLELKDTLLITIFATFIGASVSGWCATMGAPTGLRQISISRYSLGWWPSKVMAILNGIEQLGWSAAGSITGGIALSAVSDGKIGSELGVVICAVIGLFVSFFGLKVLFQYEKFAWLVFLVIFLVMYGETAGFGDVKTPSTVEGVEYSAMCLTLFGVIYGSSASWASLISDYYVEYPVNTSRVKVFTLSTLGIAVPTCIGMVLGCVIASALNNNEVWADAYDNGVGFLIQTMIHPYGFAKFILVILVFSSIGMNAISIYSASLSFQQFSRPMALVPRFIWTFICFVIIILLGLAGRDELLTYLEDFLSLLGYVTTSFFVIVFTEHYLFRKGNFDNYQLESWNDPKNMPIGFAGGLAFALGIVGCKLFCHPRHNTVLGMSTTWYVGVVADKIAGGDIGNELALVFSAVTFIPTRYLELKYVGR